MDFTWATSLSRKECDFLSRVVDSLSGDFVMDRMIAGSRVEGYGNSQSDIDVYVVCRYQPTVREIEKPYFCEIDNENDLICTNPYDRAFSAYAILPHSGLHLDIKFITLEYVDRIYEKILTSYDINLHDDTIFYLPCLDLLNYEERMFFHRLGYSEYLDNNQDFERVRLSRPIHEYLSIQFRQRALSSPKVRDIKGAVEVMDFFQAGEIARLVAINQLLGLMHFRGYTNPNIKWVHIGAKDYAPNEFKKLIGVMSPSSCQNKRQVCELLEYTDSLIREIREGAQDGQWGTEFQKSYEIFKTGYRRREAHLDGLNWSSISERFYNESSIPLVQFLS